MFALLTGSNTTAPLLTGLLPLPMKCVWDVFHVLFIPSGALNKHRLRHSLIKLSTHLSDQISFVCIVMNRICASILPVFFVFFIRMNSKPSANLESHFVWAKESLSTSLYRIILQIDYKVVLMMFRAVNALLWGVLSQALRQFSYIIKEINC